MRERATLRRRAAAAETTDPRGGAGPRGSHGLSRSVFTDGQYPDIFRPDDRANPFHRLYAQKRDAVITLLERHPPGRILDLGGGPGRIAVPLARRHEVTLADISKEMLERARETARRAGTPPASLHATQVDAASPLPFPPASFDIAIALDLLVHLANPVAALREMRRVVTPDGLIVVDTTNRHARWMLRYPAYAGRRPDRWLRTWQAGGVLPEWQGIVAHHSRREFRAMIAAAGLRTVTERMFGPRLAPKHFLAVCRPDPASGPPGGDFPLRPSLVRDVVAALKVRWAPPAPPDQPLVLPVAGGAGALLPRRDCLRLASLLDPGRVTAGRGGLRSWLERRQARRSALVLVPDRATAMSFAARWRLDLARVRTAPDLSRPPLDVIDRACGAAGRHVGRRPPWYAQ